MSDTTFTNGVTLTDADWFNDVNRLHYTIFGDPANLAAVRTTLAASDTEKGTIEYAVQSEMEAGSSTTLAVTPGRQHYHPSAAKGWCFFDTSGGATVSYNVASVTDVGTGEATINWATDFSSANFCAVCTPLAGPMAAMTNNGNTAGTSATRNYNQAGVLTDNSGGYIVAFGDQ